MAMFSIVRHQAYDISIRHILAGQQVVQGIFESIWIGPTTGSQFHAPEIYYGLVAMEIWVAQKEAGPSHKSAQKALTCNQRR